MSSTFNPVVYIPNNLDIEKHLAKYPPLEISSFNPDKALYILGLISSIPSMNKRLFTPDGYVPIHAHTLQNNMRDYRAYIDYLIHTNVIESDNFYIPDSKSYSFRFTDEYNTLLVPVPVKRYTIRKLVSQNSAIGIVNSKQSKNNEDHYIHLKQWFNDKLVIDQKSANASLIEQFNRNKTITSEFNARRKYYLNRLGLERFSKLDFFFIVDDTAGRLHTNLTNINSSNRNYITYDGYQLVSIDIKNSQPLLSTALLNEKFYLEARSSKRAYFNNYSNTYININEILQEYQYINLNTSGRIQDIVSSLMIGKNELSDAAVEFQQYIDLTGQGVIYEYIEKAVSAKTGKIFNSRKELKAVIFQVLFTDNRFFGQREAEAKRIFKDLYPNVYNLFSLIKKGDATTLPRLLQTIEAKIILQRVCYRISKENPYLPIFTIHDSVVCPVGQENYIASIIKEEMINAIGISPSLKYEYWTPDASQA